MYFRSAPLSDRPGAVLAGAVLLVASVGSAPLLPAAQESPARPQDGRAAVTRHLDMAYPPPSFRSIEEWRTRSESLRRQILVAAGLWPLPERCDLKPRSFGRIDRREYSIEKVYFESLPGFFVTGNVYRPLGKAGPFPAVLCPHGHWPYGRLQNSEECSVPAVGAALAKLGCVVFAYDMVGYNDSRQIDHRFAGEREALWGFGSLGLHLWNSIRSLDFLETLPDVDGKRIACTGASGGGTQTFLLAAVDDRVAVSAPVNMVSAYMQGGDVCENAPNLRIDTSNVEIAALAAPRPMLLVSATGDWTKNTLEVEFPAIQKLYRLFGAEEKVSAVRVDAGHNLNRESREHVYRWLARWLLGMKDVGNLREGSTAIEPLPDMLVFYGTPPPPDAKTQQQVIEEFIERARSAVEAGQPKDAAGLQRFRAAFEPALRYSLMAEEPNPGEVRAFSVEPAQFPSYRVVRFALRRAGKDDHVPATVWIPGGTGQVRRSVLLVHPNGAAEFESSGAPAVLVRALLAQGCSVLIPDVFNTGRSRFDRHELPKYFTTYNRTDHANRVQDVLTSLAYLRQQGDSLPLKMLGFGEAGLWCLLARGLARFPVATAVDAGAFDASDDKAFLARLNVPGIRRAGDLRAAAVLDPDVPLWVFNASASFPADWILRTYAAVGKARHLRIDTQRADELSLTAWIVRDTPGR